MRTVYRAGARTSTLTGALVEWYVHGMKIIGAFLVSGALFAACGGDTVTVADAGAKDSSNNNDGAVNDGAVNDSGVIADAGGNCTPPNTPCNPPCPNGTVCLQASGPTPHDLGCTPIPPACTNGVATCACMASCFCPPTGVNKCSQMGSGLTYLVCDNGTKSRREFKKDIDYVSDAERDELANEALSIPLATYRYKTEPSASKKHLGFIIDDQPENSPAVHADQTHVDEYGYTSMLLATVQRQQREIDALNKRMDALQNLMPPSADINARWSAVGTPQENARK